MDQKERQPEKLTIDKDAQINVVVNAPNDGDDSIDLGRVFHNMKLKRRVFAWVLVLCLVVGVCAPLLLYQFSKPMLTVASAVTLKYEVNGRPVSDLTAPDGEPLDLSMITSSYVLQQAMNGMELSQPITLSALRNNISIEKVLTDESRQAQELASKMTDDKEKSAYEQIESIEMKYDTRFVVRLKNGFGDETNSESRVLMELKDEELKALLDRILAAYNDYLVETYANLELPDDEITVVEEAADLDILEQLDQLRLASDHLYTYCEDQPDSIKAYRSYRNGRNLNDWMVTIQTGREVSIDYLYSHVYTNTIAKQPKTMITSYEYQLRDVQTKLDALNKNIATNESILADYKNDQIYVSMQESDASRSTMTTTEYYNNLVLEQAENYAAMAKLEIQKADLNDKLARLKADDAKSSDEAVAEAEAELKQTIAACRSVFDGVTAHMEELKSSAFFTDYAEHTVPQGKLDNFLIANLKKIIIGAVAGAVIACGLWFLAALAPEFRRNRKEDETGKEAAQA